MAINKYRIEDQVGVLSVSPTGWSKELNLLSWNDGPVRCDLRDWSPDHKTPTSGIALTKSEVKKAIKLYEEWRTKARKPLQTTGIMSERFEIREHLGVIGKKKGMTRELNIVSWNGGLPKFDIRDWAYGHTYAKKGATLREEEMDALTELVIEYKL